MGWALAVAATWVVLGLGSAILLGRSIRLADRRTSRSGRHDHPTPNPPLPAYRFPEHPAGSAPVDPGTGRARHSESA